MVVKLTTLWAAAAATAAGLAGTALAADTASSAAPVTSLFLPGVDNAAKLVASVVSIKAPATTYLVECAEDGDKDDCGAAAEGVSVTMGPDSYALGIGKPATAKQTCLMNGDTATCTAWQKGAGDAEDQSTVLTQKDITSDAYFAAVTLTAGVEKLEAAATASGSGGGSGDGGSPTPTAGGAPASGPAATGTPAGDAQDSAAASPWAAAPPPAVLTGLVALIGCALAL